MKHLIIFTLFFLSTACWLAAGEPHADLGLLQGTWQVVFLSEKGKDVPKEVTDMVEIVIDKDTFTASEKGVVGAQYRIKLGATKTPKQFDFTHLIGESKGGVEPGIYRFEKDQIRLILDEDRKGRPTVFEGKETTSYSVILLEKKPTKDKESK